MAQAMSGLRCIVLSGQVGEHVSAQFCLPHIEMNELGHLLKSLGFPGETCDPRPCHSHQDALRQAPRCGFGPSDAAVCEFPHTEDGRTQLL